LEARPSTIRQQPNRYSAGLLFQAGYFFHQVFTWWLRRLERNGNAGYMPNVEVEPTKRKHLVLLIIFLTVTQTN
jgi:hypothetical protein